jgi:hypothetical protein
LTAAFAAALAAAAIDLTGVTSARAFVPAIGTATAATTTELMETANVPSNPIFRIFILTPPGSVNPLGLAVEIP